MPSPDSFLISVTDRASGKTYQTKVSGDQYILEALEEIGIELPYACRNGACTTCAMRVKSGQVDQPEAMGLSARLQQQGYALICVGYACSDLQLETQDENEVYMLQFGQYFAQRFAKGRKPLFGLPWEMG